MCRRLHGSFAEAEVQQRAKVAKHRLAADDEDPGVSDGVEGVEAESFQVLVVVTEWMNGVHKACNLQRKDRDGVMVGCSVCYSGLANVKLVHCLF